MNLEYIVTTNKYQNINQILKQEFKISARLQHKLIISQHVYLNNTPVDTRSEVSNGDVIKVDLEFKEDNSNIVPTEMNLDIIFEDDSLLIINKPAGIAVHPSILHYEDSLSNGIKYYFDSKNIHKKIRPVNRLDLNTSGLIIFAKNEYVQEDLIKQMNSGIFKKEYLALVCGNLENNKGIIDLPIARKENSIIERCISPDGQEAITEYEVLQQYSDFSLVHCILKTGRTHQIRVHFSAIGHPLVGDSLYGKSSDLIPRQALHSYKISFIHPITKQNMSFVSDLPIDIKKVLDL